MILLYVCIELKSLNRNREKYYKSQTNGFLCTKNCVFFEK